MKVIMMRPTYKPELSGGTHLAVDLVKDFIDAGHEIELVTPIASKYLNIVDSNDDECKIHIVTPSKWLAEEVKESFLGKYEVQVIPNGIDTNVFSPHDSDIKNKLGITGKKMILGVSNSWHKYKGLYDFYELNKMIDKDKYTIVLVGVTEKQRKEVPEGIIAITKTRDVGELVDYYSAADVFVNLTYCDTFPTVNLEAQACGCMVFTYSNNLIYKEMHSRHTIMS